jgi:CubicO group peptidase (beta-lactamase class C family)
MSGRVPRRDVLVRLGQAGVGASLFHYAGCSRASQPGAERAGLPPGLPADLEERIPRLMAQANTPGLSMAIVRDARVAWTRAFGVADRGTKTPVDEATVFEAGSISKTVFAYAVMKLCEKGVLSLDSASG